MVLDPSINKSKSRTSNYTVLLKVKVPVHLFAAEEIVRFLSSSSTISKL